MDKHRQNKDLEIQRERNIQAESERGNNKESNRLKGYKGRESERRTIDSRNLLSEIYDNSQTKLLQSKTERRKMEEGEIGEGR